MRRKPGVTARARAKKRRQLQQAAKPIRAAVVKRSEGCCERCGIWVGEMGQAHHLIRRSLGGQWTMENIQLLCLFCHQLTHAAGKL